MKTYQITFNGVVLGSVTTQFTQITIQKLFEEYQNDVAEAKIPDMDEFVDWLNENHDEEAERFYFDGEIIL